MFIVYGSETIRDLNKGEYFSINLSLITHPNNKQICIIGIYNNTSKEFRIEATYNRDVNILYKFFKKYVPTSNYIVSDGCLG